MAPVVAKRLEAPAKSGKLIRHAGSILKYNESDQGVEISIRQRAAERIETVEAEKRNIMGNYRRAGSASTSGPAGGIAAG